MIFKRIIAAAAACATVMTCMAGCGSKKQKTTGMRDISTMEVVNEMGVGINLGNTFESCGDWINSSSVENYEKGWGSCVITKECIKGMADAGFGVLRVPVAWSNMMSDRRLGDRRRYVRHYEHSLGRRLVDRLPDRP